MYYPRRPPKQCHLRIWKWLPLLTCLAMLNSIIISACILHRGQAVISTNSLVTPDLTSHSEGKTGNLQNFTSHKQNVYVVTYNALVVESATHNFPRRQKKNCLGMNATNLCSTYEPHRTQPCTILCEGFLRCCYYLWMRLCGV